jgi:hypothetical protein
MKGGKGQVWCLDGGAVCVETCATSWKMFMPRSAKTLAWCSTSSMLAPATTLSLRSKTEFTSLLSALRKYSAESDLPDLRFSLLSKNDSLPCKNDAAISASRC